MTTGPEEMFISDILLVEDVAETVEGLESDLRARGAAVVRVGTVSGAQRALKQERWSVVLFDLRLPEDVGDEPTIAAGLELMRQKAVGELGETCRETMFAIISLQTIVSELDEVRDFPGFIGMFSKAEDSRRLFRSLHQFGVLGKYFLDEVGESEYRQRVKFLCTGIDDVSSEMIVALPSWGSGVARVRLDSVRRSVRERARSDSFPFFIYGTANVAATNEFELAPADLDQVEEYPDAYRLVKDEGETGIGRG